MKILVTGGAGFIGSNFIHYMLDRYPNYELINLDALTYAGNLTNLSKIPRDSKHSFIKGDITDKEQMNRLFGQGIDIVVHFAAESHVDRSIVEPDIFTKNNVWGTQVLLDAAVKVGVKKFVHVSTDEVYGTLGETGLFTEQSPLHPNSPYAASKAGSDLLVRAYHETFGLPVNITRCSNNYGPYQFPEKLIPLMLVNALNDRPLPIYGDGLHIRDWLYVEDHCHAIDLVLHQGKNGEVYNIGGSNEKTNIQIVQTILKELGKPESLIRHVPDRLGHDRRYGIDATKIMNELGWHPKHHFETGILETIQWYLDHQDWWMSILTGNSSEPGHHG
ncbi:dTDP-glucose 4,6-dehydratase [Paenibacillus sp. BK720]|uniref:dTDP-glucose 4,6-dehydratase n=1 Tax=Paenibacillus sp. BK720 TaxID=2587092 RepID=UPI001420C5E0|nr:dTDP-glucose 4,6-dehydratase [Paenibacillus sp. BK720]NIK69959.1 dTDP-glucose 4,6-dehydratase [Paenibacillus sp. BK720]